MKKYNILFITSDQQHYNTIGKFNSEIKTPNLDRLCDSGTYFNRAYTVNPTCTPTRASMITGLYPSQHGSWTLGTKLSEDVPTIGKIMGQNNIKMALVGKAHFQPLASTDEYPSLESYPILHDLEFWKNFSDDFYGFQTVKLARNHTNEAHAGQHYALWMEQKGFTNWRDYFLPPDKNFAPLCSDNVGKMDKTIKYEWGIPEEYHYDNWIAEETNNLLEEYKKNNEQFFLWASFFDPHPSYFLPKGWGNMYDPEKLTLPHAEPNEHDDSPEVIKKTQEETPDFSKYNSSGYALHGLHSHVKRSEAQNRKDLAVYYEMVTLMDKYIGKILDKLDELDLTKDTIVVFTTDHGHYLGHHGLIAKGPFMYEDAIKVPYIVSCPETVTQNKVNSSMQSIVDLPVTFLDYCNIKIPYNMTGVNQRDVWEGKKQKVRDCIVCEHNHERDTLNVRAYVDEKYKIVVHLNDTYGEIYDLENDPKEIINLWDKNPELRQELLMKYIFAELKKESLFMPRIAHA